MNSVLSLRMWVDLLILDIILVGSKRAKVRATKGKSDRGTHYGWFFLLDEWHKFDDDKVSIVRDADIEKLDGGGDWHTAYIVLYRAKQLD